MQQINQIKRCSQREPKPSSFHRPSQDRRWSPRKAIVLLTKGSLDDQLENVCARVALQLATRLISAYIFLDLLRKLCILYQQRKKRLAVV